MGQINAGVASGPAPLRWHDYLFINAYWGGLSFMWNGLHIIILPAMLLYFVPSQLKATYLGMMTFVGLLLAMVIQPLSGALSDYTSTRWGRRRPWIALGAAGSLLCLLVLGWASSYLMLAAGYIFLQITSNLAHGPLQGLIPDLVPARQHGLASGVKNILDLAGFLAGIAIAGFFVGRGESRLALVVCMAVIFCTALITLGGTREPSTQAGKSLQLGQTLRRALRRAYQLKIGSHSAYAWLLLARFCVLTGVYGVQAFALYFLIDVPRVPPSASSAAILLIIGGLAVVLLVVLAGPLSDRWGRKQWNVASAILCAAGIFFLIGAGSFKRLALAGALLGTGLGSFLSVNWAWATDLVPEQEAGKFLGLSNLATAGASAISRLGGPFVDLLNLHRMGAGYDLLFFIAGMLSLAGAFILWRFVPDPLQSQK